MPSQKKLVTGLSTIFAEDGPSGVFRVLDLREPCLLAEKIGICLVADSDILLVSAWSSYIYFDDIPWLVLAPWCKISLAGNIDLPVRAQEFHLLLAPLCCYVPNHATHLSETGSRSSCTQASTAHRLPDLQFFVSINVSHTDQRDGQHDELRGCVQ